MAGADAGAVHDPLKIPLEGIEVLVHFMDNTSLRVKGKVDSTVGMLNVVLRDRVSFAPRWLLSLCDREGGKRCTLGSVRVIREQ